MYVPVIKGRACSTLYHGSRISCGVVGPSIPDVIDRILDDARLWDELQILDSVLLKTEVPIIKSKPGLNCIV